MQSELKVKLYLFLFTLTAIFLSSGARLVSSDEVSMYLTVESIVKHGTLALPPENTPNSTLVNGKAYTWYEAGNIIAGIPLYLIGEVVKTFFPIPESMKEFLPRAAVSYTNAFVGAWIALLFFIFCRKMGLSIRTALGMSLALTFSTFLLPYYKLYLREPTLTLCLLGGFMYLVLYQKEKITRYLYIAGSFLGFGILTKLVFAINLLPILIYLIWILFNSGKTFSETFKQTAIFLIPVILIGFVGSGIYNYLRFGDPFDTGYTGGRSFPIPFYVGMFGLLLSPGKGILWFAPILFLLPVCIKHFYKNFPAETYSIFGIFILNLTLSSMYIAWGGDGSWGPRYLTPLLPLLLFPIAIYFTSLNAIFKKVFFSLVIIGCLVQIGGVSIYAGAYLREIGEYPYQRHFDDPEFLAKAHFIPNYSPILGHWEMFARNLGEHFRGNYPQLKVENDQNDKRLPIAQEDHSKLLHTLDFWFTYALYTGVSKNILTVALAFMAIVTLLFGTLLYRTVISLSN